MKVVICYFSGTGNTGKIVERYRECLVASGASVDIFAIEQLLDAGMPQEFVNTLTAADLIGFGYPVHAFNAPSIVLDFVKSLPQQAEHKRAFVISSSGEPLQMNNISSLKAKRILKRRNIDVTNEYRYVMPYNIMFRHTDAMAYRMWNTAQKIIPLDVSEMLDGREHHLKRVLCGNFLAWVMRCEHWGAQLNGKHYKVSDKCAGCQKCIKLCPTKNIALKDGTIKFGNKCLMCQRCVQLCPRNAIKMGWFDKWKVNGAYTFAETQDTQPQKYNRMLTKAYKKYFEENENRIKENDA